MTICQTEKQRLIISIVLVQKYYLAFRKGQFLVRFFQYFLGGSLFFLVKDIDDIDIAGYADDSTPFIVENYIDNVIASLEQVSDALFNWFKNNPLKSNADKCHLLFSTNKPVGIEIGDYRIDNSECEKLLGVKIDVNLNFNDHISYLFKKASRKVSALAMSALCYNRSSPPLMKSIFKLRAENSYNLRQVSEFSMPMVKSVYHRIESISNFGPKIWKN